MERALRGKAGSAPGTPLPPRSREGDAGLLSPPPGGHSGGLPLGRDTPAAQGLTPLLGGTVNG